MTAPTGPRTTMERASRGADLGPRERHAKMDPVALEPAGRGGVRARVRAQDALDRYALRGELAPGDAAENRRLRDAALRLRLDWTKAGLEATVTSGYAEVVQGGPRPDRMACREDAYRGFRDAIQAVGPVAAQEVIEAACLGNPVGRLRLEILRRGLAVLADHYEKDEIAAAPAPDPRNKR